MAASDFAQFLSTQADIPNSTPYVPVGSPETWSSAYRPLGLPPDPASLTPPPGLESTTAADLASPAISNLQGIWETIKDDSSSAVTAAYGGTKNIISTVYGDVAGGVKTVVGDIASPISGALSSTYWYVIGAVAVLGAVIYFAGKSGALRVRG